MKTVKFCIVSLAALSVVTLGPGCATTPKVADVVQEAPSKAPQIASAEGVLSPEKSKALLEKLKRAADPTDMLARQLAVVESVSGTRPIKGNRVTLLVDGPAAYAAMFKAIRAAQHHINLETYIFEDIKDAETGHKLADLLLRKQSEGVQVHLLYDSVGSFAIPPADPFIFKRLRDGGIEAVEFNPVNPLKAHGKLRTTHRDHRKMLVVDGKVVITGGINISEEYSSGGSASGEQGKEKIPWRDTDVQIEGPAVAEFQKLFVDSWQRAKGPKLSQRNFFPHLGEKGDDLVEVVGSTPEQQNRTTFIMYVSAFIFAEKSIHLTNAYFVPDRQTVKTLTDAAGRGVDVKLILPKVSDSWLPLAAGRYHYSELLEGGVKLYEHRTAMLHAKTAVIDGVWSTVGSTNLDFLSFLENDEVNAIILSRRFAGEMEKMFARDLQESDQIQLREWQSRPLFPRLMEWIGHLFSKRL